MGGIGGLFASVITTAAVAVILDEIDAGRRIFVRRDPAELYYFDLEARAVPEPLPR